MVLWTDSICVFHWLQSEKMLSLFIQRRVDEIKPSGNIYFSYLAIHDILGDIASRGINYKNASYVGMDQTS